MRSAARGGVSLHANTGAMCVVATIIGMSSDQVAVTAGVQDHSDPARFRGEVADSPIDTGLPPMDPDEARLATLARHTERAGYRTGANWRNCRASETLVDAVDARWPMRDTAGDGTIGNAAQPSRRSDHHPWMIINSQGVVRARCFGVNGIDAAWLAEQLRRLGAAGDPRLTNGGYVIFNERITSGDWRTWRRYTGADPHTTRLHVSFSLSLAGFDNPAPWVFLEDDTVTPQDLRAVVNGLLDTQVPVRSSGKGYTTLRQVITTLDRAIVPVQAPEPSETHELVQKLQADLAELRDVLTQFVQTATPPAPQPAHEGNRG